MYQPGGVNINLNLGNQGIHGPGGCRGPRRGRGGPLQRMMRRLQQMMARLTGQGQQGQCCCPGSRPSFGHGGHQQGAGININMGASIRGFLG